MKQKISQETQTEALKVAKGIQKQKQTKEQTKLIAQGIEKGIAEYKKQQSKKSRERDKTKKSLLKDKSSQAQQSEEMAGNTTIPSKKMASLPWILLVVSWLSFLVYLKTV